MIIQQQAGRMREEKNSVQALEILCIGEMQAGKSYFLNKYTQDQFKQTLNSSYAIFAKKLHSKFIIFHELSEEEAIYLQKQYDGVLFFVDLAGAWNVTQNILKWMEIQSRLTGTNIFKIPLRVIITKTKPYKNADKWRGQLQKQLSSLINEDQIIYFEDDLQSVQQNLDNYFTEIQQGRSAGIKPTHHNNFRLYGFTHFYKLFSTNAKLTFFRNVEVLEKYVRGRINFLMKTKSN